MLDAILPAPAAWKTVAVEQVRLIGLRFRMAGAALLALGIAIAVAFVWIMQRWMVLAAGLHDRMVQQALASSGHGAPVPPLQGITFFFSPSMGAIVTALALVVPLAIWQDEAPSQRGYHLVMPMRASTHLMLRVFAGWVWMMAITILYLAVIWATIGTLNALAPIGMFVHMQYSATWEWLVPFTAMTIAYLFASGAAVGARRPLVWLGGIGIVYYGAITLLGMLQFRHAAELLARGYFGYYGASAALMGDIAADGGLSSLTRWLGATLIWGVASAALLLTISARHADR